jgi:hypothetical protein
MAVAQIQGPHQFGKHYPYFRFINALIIALFFIKKKVRQPALCGNRTSDLLANSTACKGQPSPALGRYGESVGAIGVIDRQEKLVVHAEVTDRYAN